MMNKEQNIIGMKYIPQDNSYSINLSNPNNRISLAGTAWKEAKVTTLICKPFEIEILNGVGNRDKLKFVMVLFEKDTYLYMWHEHGLVTDKNTTEYILSRMQFASPYTRNSFFF